MNYVLLLYLFCISGVAGLVVPLFICAILETLYELRDETVPDFSRLYAVLIIPCWIIMWIVFYIIFNNYH